MEKINSKIAIQKSQKEAEVYQAEQIAQVNLAKNAGMEIVARPGSLTRVEKTPQYDKHIARIPLDMANIPDALMRYNIRCTGVEVSEGVYVDSSKFHTECNMLQARNNNGVWQYSLYSPWSGIELSAPEIVISFTTAPNQPVPNFKYVKIALMIPSGQGELYWGSLGEVQATVLEQRLSVKVQK